MNFKIAENIKTGLKWLLIRALLISVFTPVTLFASGNGITAGQTLLQAPSGRAAALAEAYSAMTDDVAAMNYNPASLNSLQESQASFLYQKGLADDSYGNFMMGTPLSQGTLGFNFGYYNAGTFDYFDGTKVNALQAKRDLTASLGYAIGGHRWSLGVAGKYIQSELLQTNGASALAADLGAQAAFSKSFVVGAALQNMGTNMTYLNDAQSLPRIARAGFQWNLPMSMSHLSFLADLPYYLNEKDLRPAFGLETLVGPMALRAGYRTKGDQAGLTFGAGFMFGKMSLDYSYGLVKDFNAEQRVSVSMKFGGDKPYQSLSRYLQQNNIPEVTFSQRSPSAGGK